MYGKCLPIRILASSHDSARNSKLAYEYGQSGDGKTAAVLLRIGSAFSPNAPSDEHVGIPSNNK